jgi:hypothetical protein
LAEQPSGKRSVEKFGVDILCGKSFKQTERSREKSEVTGRWRDYVPPVCRQTSA